MMRAKDGKAQRRRPEGKGASGAQCPVCGAAAVDDYRPFCGRRCADVDLHRWFGEAYRLPEEPAVAKDVAKDR